MTRTLHADLLTAQVASSIQPAIQAVFTCATPPAGQGTTYDYSFDPTVSTNRLEDILFKEEPFDEYAVITLRNNDLVVPDLVGYYVDLGIGANTASGLKYGTYPRLWVKDQTTLSGGAKGQRANLKSILELRGVWNILKEQKVLIGGSPKYQDNYGMLTGKTIYGMLEYLIETTLVAATGINFTLDALGDQDDTVINSLVLEPTHDPDDPFLNQKAPKEYETFADVFERLFAFTGCFLRAKAGLAFKVIYPQASDAIDENYYSSLSAGHVFYENTELKFVKEPNRVFLFVTPDEEWASQADYTAGNATFIQGVAYSSDWNLSGIPYVFTGQYIPITEIVSDTKSSVNTDQMANKVAKFILEKHSAETFGGRILVPHDARVELYDRVAVFDTRGT